MVTKKIKISSVKRAAHLKSKKTPLSKQQQQKAAYNDKKQQNVFLQKSRKFDQLTHQKKHNKHQVKNVLKENDEDDEQFYDKVADMLDGDDLAYLQSKGTNKQRKRKQNLDTEQDTDAVGLEVAYASENVKEQESKKVKISLLPIKSREGEIITRSTEVDYKLRPKLAKKQEDENMEEEEEKILSVYEDSDEDILNDNENNLPKDEPEKKMVTTTDLLIARQQEVDRQKYRIGIICSGILEKPEDKMRNFNALFELMDETNASGVQNLFTVRRLAIMSITEIFKDILPEYRVGQVDPKMQTVRKTTLERVTYENTLLQLFKKFLLKMERLTAVITKRQLKNINSETVALAKVAVQSMCAILTAHPYFNYVQNIAQLLVYMLNSNFPTIREAVRNCFTTLFANDMKLDMTLYIVRRINHLIKTKSNNVHLECITCLLSLKIKNVNLDAEKEKALKQKKLESHKHRLMALSKKERKRRKKLTELNKELDETRAEEDKQSKHYKLTEIIKMVFTIYFRVLKNDPTSKVLSAILEGLAEYAHVINIDFFADLIEVLNRIIEHQDLGYREQLHCIQTIFVILSGQGEVLNIDPIRFYKHFYKNMFAVNAGKNHDDFQIVLKTLDEVLVKRKRNMSSQRLMAFVKRLLTISMHLLHHGTLAALGTIKTTFQLTSALDILLDTDSSVGSGKYDPLLDDPEYCNSSCTALYELTRLARHYHPIVRKMAIHIATGVPASGEGSLPSDLGKLTCHEFFAQYDSTQMVFNPTIPMPRQLEPKIKKGHHNFIKMNFKSYYSDILKRSKQKRNGTFDFSEEVIKNKKSKIC